MLTKRAFAHILKSLKLQHLPREVGLGRHMIYDPYTLTTLYIHNRHRDHYISTNSYYDFDRYGMPTNVYVTKTLFDLDTAYQPSIETAWNDLKKLAEYYRENNLNYAMQISGNGFHFLPLFKGKIYTLEPIPEQRTVTIWMKRLQKHHRDELGLRSINIQTAEARRMMRFPMTYNTKAGRWCFPLPYDATERFSFKDIIELASHPEPPVFSELTPPRAKNLTIRQTLKFFGIKTEVTSPIPNTRPENGNHHAEDLPPAHIFVDNFFNWPCIKTILKDKNPPHAIRFTACAIMRQVFDLDTTIRLFDEMANGFEWNDRHNRARRIHQIQNIYANRYNPMSCPTILNTLKKYYDDPEETLCKNCIIKRR